LPHSHSALLEWFEPYLTSISKECQECGIDIEVSIYITREKRHVDQEAAPSFATFRHGSRPDVVSAVKTAYKECERLGKMNLAVVTCGPFEMMRLTANAASSLQSEIRKKDAKVKEVYLVSGVVFLRPYIPLVTPRHAC
jgi:hypothetical protein